MRMIAARVRLAALGLAVFLMGASGLDVPPLVEAAKKADREAVRALLAQGADVNATDGDGSTALHWASYWDDLESVELLIRAGARVDLANELGATPLWAAAVNRSAAMTRRLLEAGANPNAALLRGETVLMAAARTGNPEVVEALLAKGADVNAQAARGETIPCLFDKSRTCSMQAGGQTALMWAVANKHADVVALLLARGADIHARSHVWSEIRGIPPHPIPSNQRAFPLGGNTALMYAARGGDLASARLLVAAGANVNDADAWGISAMALAAFADAGEVVRHLLEHAADPNLPSSEFSPLHAAILRRDDETVAALLAKGADPNTPLRTWTPERRASVDFSFHPAWVGASPLWLAARFGTPRMMRLLAESGADPNFVHRSAYYGGGSDIGIDAFLFTEHTTILMAAVGMGGPGRAWVRETAGQRGARILEAAKVAVELGVDVNATNFPMRTCDVEWAEAWALARRNCVENTPFDSTPRSALYGARTLRLNSVVEFLVQNGATVGLNDPVGPAPRIR